ncbi:MAG: hypothetical protein M3498_00535 [Deinococcota bacterium]|jgi:hypothetical protein|nr:hypothetical protein [Deinococcota bacterium]
MAKTLVVQLAANALGEDVQEMVTFLETQYPVETLTRETTLVMVRFSAEVDESELEDDIRQHFNDVVSGGLEWS